MKQIILMADIVKSGEKEATSLMRHFEDITVKANSTFKRKIKSPLTITLGDEFQGVIADLNTAIDLILFFEEEIIRRNAGFKLRFVVVQGNIETPINSKSGYKMLGIGLTSAREKINNLKNSSERFLFSLDNNHRSKLLNHAFYVVQALMDGWNTKRDFLLITTFIEHKDYKTVAERLKKSRSQIWKREKSLHIKSYLAMKEIIYLSLQ